MSSLAPEEIDALCKAIAHRRSFGVSRLDRDKPVDSAIIEKMLAAADWGTSNDDTEPWRLTIFTGDSRHALGEAFAAAYATAVGAEAFKQTAADALRERATNAPIWIAIGMSPALKEDGSYETSEEEEAIAVGTAIQNLHLVAAAHGLAGMWLSGLPMMEAQLASFVGLEAPARLLGFIFFGWPAIPWPAGERKPIDGKIKWAEPRQ